MRSAVKLLVIIGVLVATAAATMSDAALAKEDPNTARARLNGFHEVTPKLSDGTATVNLTLSPSSIKYTLTISKGLSTPVTQAHLHFGQPAVNGGVFVWLCGNTPTTPAGVPACPSLGGTVSGTLMAKDVQPLADQGLDAGNFAGALRIIRSGDAYANVHTTRFPGGEIRGQVVISEGSDSD